MNMRRNSNQQAESVSQLIDEPVRRVINPRFNRCCRFMIDDWAASANRIFSRKQTLKKNRMTTIVINARKQARV